MKLLKIKEAMKPAYLDFIEDHADFFVVHLKGDLDMHALEDNRDKMTEVIEQFNLYGKSILCDFTRVTNCDTATVAGLITRLAQFRKTKGSEHRKILFFNITGQLCALFQITHLEELFQVFDTREQAEAELKFQQRAVPEKA